MDMTTRYIELIVSSLVTLLGIILSWWLRYKYGEYKAKKNNKELSQARLIQTILEQQLVEHHAQRAFILQRHNGGKFGTGKSMNKLSTTYEALEEGVSAESQKYQNLPMSLYSAFVNSVTKSTAIYPEVESIDDILTRAFFTQRGSKSAIVFPITKNDDFVGMVGFEWTHRPKNIERTYKEISDDGRLLGETLSKLL